MGRSNFSYEAPNLSERVAAASASGSFHASHQHNDSSSVIPSSRMLHSSGGGGNDGGNMLESRVAKLDAEIENIKNNLSEAKEDISRIRDTAANTSRDVAVILQKMTDIDEKLSKTASKNDVLLAVTSSTNKQIAWIVATAITLISAMKYFL